MALDILQIRNRINTLAKKVNAPIDLLNIPDKPVGDGTPHLEIKGESYHYVVSERGNEFSRKSTNDEEELFYWIFYRIASDMASSYELQNRIEGQDSRRLRFSYLVSLLNDINPSWREKAEMDIQAILNNAPYDDLSDVRIKYTKKLQKKGVSADKAYEEACKKYPLPS